MNMIRRNFLRSALVSIGNLGWLGQAGRRYALAQATENRGSPAPGCNFFNAAQARTLEVICEQIIPADDQPGAKGAGVLYFIDKALSTWAPEHRWDYLAGLEGVDESSRAMFGGDFAGLKWDQQTKVLEAMEKGSAPGKIWQTFHVWRSAGQGRFFGAAQGEGGNSGQQFFNLLIRHTMQGYYADSKYGGNRDGASWKMIGYVGAKHH